MTTKATTLRKPNDYTTRGLRPQASMSWCLLNTVRTFWTRSTTTTPRYRLTILMASWQMNKFMPYGRPTWTNSSPKRWSTSWYPESKLSRYLRPLTCQKVVLFTEHFLLSKEAGVRQSVWSCLTQIGMLYSVERTCSKGSSFFQRQCKENTLLSSIMLLQAKVFKSHLRCTQVTRSLKASLGIWTLMAIARRGTTHLPSCHIMTTPPKQKICSESKNY